MRHKLLLAAAALVTSGAFASAHATVVFTNGNDPQQPGEQNVLYGSSQTGALITGTTNQSGTTIDFASSTDTLMTTASGQANLTAQDGLINAVTITAPGHTFGDLIINPFLGTGNPPPTAATVSVTTNDGVFTDPVTLGNGNNFLTMVASAGETISSVSITSTGGFADLRQVRISELSGVSVPEPATLSLLGIGLIGAAYLRRRRAAAA